MVELDALNRAVNTELSAFVQACEARYRHDLESICAGIRKSGCRALLIAGPSCAGKTTTSSLAAQLLVSAPGRVYNLSLDDYFHNVDDQRAMYGENVDFDAIEALNLELLHSQLAQMMNGQSTRLPRFDFLQGRRVDSGRTAALAPGDFLIVEGIHALHPQVLHAFSGQKVQTMFIDVEEEVVQNGSVLFSKRDLRFLRRIVRDYRFRGSSVENTYRLWDNVVKNEEKSLLPYRGRAAYRLNTFIGYECALLSADVRALLPAAQGTPYAKDAARLLRATSELPSVPRCVVPKGSLLEEFVGRP